MFRYKLKSIEAHKGMDEVPRGAQELFDRASFPFGTCEELLDGGQHHGRVVAATAMPSPVSPSSGTMIPGKGAGFSNGRLYLWSMKDGPDGDVEWVQRRVIQHKTMLRTRGLSTPPEVVGFADGHGLIFVRTGNTVFSMELKSGHVRKVYTCRSRNYDVIVVPYMSFYTPDDTMGRLPSP